MSRDYDSPREIDDPLDPAVANALVERHGFLSWLGVTFETLETGRAVMRLPHDEKLTNWATGVVHGGVTASAIDTCSAFALRTCFPDLAEVSLATTDLDVKYVRPATSDLRIEAEVIRVGDSVGVTRVDVTGESPDGEEKLVAIGATTYRLFTGHEA